MRPHRTLVWGVSVGAAVAAAVVYSMFDPAENGWFPRCVFRTVTGFECPGCGAQRAIHRLLHFDICGALRQNALIVVAIPYVALLFALDTARRPTPRMMRWRDALFSPTAICIVLAVVVAFWIARNLPWSGGWL